MKLPNTHRQKVLFRCIYNLVVETIRLRRSSARSRGASGWNVAKVFFLCRTTLQPLSDFATRRDWPLSVRLSIYELTKCYSSFRPVTGLVTGLREKLLGKNAACYDVTAPDRKHTPSLIP